MSKSVTYICFVQDHSGSMEHNRQLAIDNFNEQRAKLLKEDDDTMDNFVTVIEFDDEIHCNIDGEPIANIKEMEKWWTGGMTALYDAIGYAIVLLERKLGNDPRQDKAVLVVVQTDGQENQSSDYQGEEGRKRIKEKIDALEATKIWTFTFLGENIDESVAMDMGFKRGNIMKHDKHNVAHAYACNTSGLGDFMKSRKRGETQTYSFYAGNNVNNDNSSK
jgi:Mg-chelatase subunit ChlD